MTLYNDILLKAGLPVDGSIGGIKITVIDFSGILVEGHKGIFSFSETEIIIRLKKGQLIISGEKLSLIEINIDEIYVKGNILGIAKNYE